MKFFFNALSIFASFSLIIGVSNAGTDFGSDGDVRLYVDKVIAGVKTDGVEKAVSDLKNGTTEFGSAKPGLMIWIEGKMAAHNKYPDLAGLSFEDMQDLRGQFIMSDFTNNANDGGGYSLNYWPHYTSENEYEYHCFSKWIEKDKIMVTGCR